MTNLNLLGRFYLLMDSILPDDRKWTSVIHRIGRKIIYSLKDKSVAVVELGHAPGVIAYHGLDDCLWLSVVTKDGNKLDCTPFVFSDYFTPILWAPCVNEQKYPRIPRVDTEYMQWDVNLAPDVESMLRMKDAISEYLELWNR